MGKVVKLRLVEREFDQAIEEFCQAAGIMASACHRWANKVQNGKYKELSELEQEMVRWCSEPHALVKLEFAGNKLHEAQAFLQTILEHSPWDTSDRMAEDED